MPPVVAAAAIGAGAGLAGSAMNAKSASSAAKTQSKSADQALAEQKRIFDMQQANRKPFLDASTSALGNLGQLASQGRQMALPPPSGGYAPPLGGQMPPQMPPRGPAPGPMPPPMGGQGGGMMRPGPQQPQMALFQSPDGETRQFPLAMEQQLLAKGARRVQ